MKLSILIPTLFSRKKKSDFLCSYISNLIDMYRLIKNIDIDVEILCHRDNGEATIGQKRNELLGMAKGEYLCFIDDDDQISSNYIALLFEAIQTNPDCCSLNGIITTNGNNPQNFIHSLKYKNWFEENGVYYRPPNHLNCIKASIAKQFLFPDISNGEDKDWSMQIAESGILKTEYEIKETIYFYDYISNK